MPSKGQPDCGRCSPARSDSSTWRQPAFLRLMRRPCGGFVIKGERVFATVLVGLALVPFVWVAGSLLEVASMALIDDLRSTYPVSRHRNLVQLRAVQAA